MRPGTLTASASISAMRWASRSACHSMSSSLHLPALIVASSCRPARHDGVLSAHPVVWTDHGVPCHVGDHQALIFNDALRIREVHFGEPFTGLCNQGPRGRRRGRNPMWRSILRLSAITALGLFLL